MLIHSSSYLFGMAERIAEAAAEASVMSNSEADEWKHRLSKQASEGDFFSSMNYYVCAGHRD